MSFYFTERAESPLATMQMNCVHYFCDATAGALPKKIAFRHHNHETFEILAMVRGQVRITVENREYIMTPGDVIVANPFRMHFGEWIANGMENEYICITVSLSRWMSFRQSELFSEVKRLLAEQACFDEWYSHGEGEELWRYIHRIDRQFGGKEAASECRLASEIYGLFATLFDGHYHAVENEQADKRDVEFMKKVSRYLMANYAEDISTADIAGELFMTVQCFCYTFKKHFGMSFLNYLCQYRVTRATELYREREMPLSELAEQVGFSDYGYFSRSFKKYIGESPAVYFGKWSRESKGNF
ncbi:MAG: helix-turn-helix transcriptional regulator [Clostridia bacterium]|nr:helix-turn-helix transcriptional regulator [Clostridia bacterium]